MMGDLIVACGVIILIAGVMAHIIFGKNKFEEYRKALFEELNKQIS